MDCILPLTELASVSVTQKLHISALLVETHTTCIKSAFKC